MMETVKAVTSNNAREFERECTNLIEDGMIIIAADCGFIDSADLNYCDRWSAILARPDNYRCLDVPVLTRPEEKLAPSEEGSDG